MEKDVFGFEISVQNMVAVQFPEGLHQLLDNPQSLVFGEAIPLFEQFIQSAPITVLVDHVYVMLTFESLDVVNDMRASAYQTQNLDLVLQAFLEFWCSFKQLLGDDLNGDNLMRPDIGGLVYLAEGPGANLLLQYEVLDLFPHGNIYM